MGNRLLFIILTISIIAVGGTWLIVQKNTDQILQEQARAESLAWAEFIKRDIPDLERILTGAPPTIQDIRTLSTAKNVGNVFWFKIYDHDRTVVWSADFGEIGDENNERYFVDKVSKGDKYVRIIRDKKEKKVIAHAFLPLMQEEAFKGAVEVSLDLTHLAQTNQKMAITIVITIASLFIILLFATALVARIEIERERRLKAEALQAAKARNDFIALVSHELRTPLNGILGSLGLLNETESDEERAKLAQTAILSTEHLQDIINDIIDFTQLTGKRAVLHLQDISLSSFADELEGIFRFDAYSKGLEYNVIRKFPTDCDGQADLKRMRQILFNLVTNAIKFTDNGSITLTLSLSQGLTSRTLVCEVQDTGIGLDQKDQQVIFDRFHQVSNTLSRQYGGIGLGLSLCKEFSELMGGTLNVSSQLGEGSTFRLEVPFPPALNRKSAPFEQLDSQVESLDILLAEDNVINQKVIKGILENAGHLIDLAANGEIAIEMAEKRPYDLILMDIQMPLMSGLEATQHIRAHPGLNKNTPIIALSANIMADQQDEYLNAGMQGCLSKPIKPQALRQAVTDFYRDFGKLN